MYGKPSSSKGWTHLVDVCIAATAGGSRRIHIEPNELMHMFSEAWGEEEEGGEGVGGAFSSTGASHWQIRGGGGGS